jgi:hypothetical protein
VGEDDAPGLDEYIETPEDLVEFLGCMVYAGGLPGIGALDEEGSLEDGGFLIALGHVGGEWPRIRLRIDTWPEQESGTPIRDDASVGEGGPA